VGVQAYKNLAPAEQLDGARNDVAVMHGLLKERFGFAETEIVSLVDEHATSAALRAALAEVVRKVERLPAGGPPAQVLFHFSGHGSQVPDQPPGDPDHDEEDGLDETLVPYDAARQGGPQDVRDDELNAFLDQVARGGRARAWVVLDCCHSGSGTRGVTRVRELRRDLAPRAVEPGTVTPRRIPPGCVVLSACRAAELEPEFDEQGKAYGLLTRFLGQVLHEQTAVSALSYERLRDAILAHYAHDASVTPTPQLEASTPADLRAQVLGAGRECDRMPYWPARKDPDDDQQVILAAGAFHGVTAGSLYELFDRAESIGEPGKSVAWLRIAQVEGMTATCQLVPAGGKADPGNSDVSLPAEFVGGFAIERRRAPAPRRLRLKVVRVLDAGRDGPALPLGAVAGDRTLRPIHAALGGADAADGFTWVEPNEQRGNAQCELLLRVAGSFAAFFPATGAASVPRGPEIPAMSDERFRPLRGGWGPINLEADDAAARIRAMMKRIVRVHQLLGYAAQGHPKSDPSSVSADSSEGETSPAVEVSLVRVKEIDDQNQVQAAEEIKPTTAGSLQLSHGDRYAIRVRNTASGGKAIFISLLRISPDMGIQVLIPVQEGDEDGQRIEPGETKYSPVLLSKPPAGRRRVVCLATRIPHDFSTLAQPELPVTRDTLEGAWSAAVLSWETEASLDTQH
jgi:hypothetical protein